MSVRSKRMTLLLVMLGITAVLLAADDPFVGIWKLNIAKSHYNPGPLPKSSSNTYEPVPGGGLKLTVTTVTADGKLSTIERVEHYDGKPHPVQQERSGADAVATKRIDRNTIEVVNYRNGKILSSLTRRISKDGKTMTSEAKGTSPQGQPFEEFRFFDKQ